MRDRLAILLRPARRVPFRARGLAFGLLLALGCATAPRVEVTPPPPAPTPTPVVVPTPPAPSATPVPTAAPLPEPIPTAPPPVALPGADLDPPLVRVLVRRTAEPVSLPQPERAYRVSADGRSSWVWGPLELSVDAAWWWQVGALNDAGRARALGQELLAGIGPGALARTVTSAEGLVRVQVRWPEQEPPDPAALLAGLGHPGAFRVAGEAMVRVEPAAGQPVTSAGEVLLEPGRPWPTEVDRLRLRGRFWLRVVAGELLLVNQLNLERYLQGVVPVEMGPSQFPELEALKAQAVAARTYAVAHLGEHADEGWDLCGTPACQAYDGAGAEHALSDRAVAETAGLIAVSGGAPIDAMYTSTCGGHTEDAARVFPDRAQPYLRGVVCAWERELELIGEGTAGAWVSAERFAEELALVALDLEPQRTGPRDVVDRVAAACGGEPGQVASADPVATFARALLVAAGLDRAAAVLARSDEPLQGLLGLCDLREVALGPPPVDWDAGWHLGAGLAMLEVQGVVTRDRGEAVPRPEGVGIFPSRAERSETLPSPLPLYERWAGAVRSRAVTTVLPGTSLERVRRGERVLALVVVRSGGGGEADRRSAWRSWARELEWSALADRLGVPDLERLEVSGRGASGRVAGLVAIGRTGSRREWQGFEVRRALELPESLFTVHVMTRDDGRRVARFLGRGWGHGIGLCQNGAYGLARAGRRFEEILATYYPGTSLVRWAGTE